jgi:pilus assembly protein Flp/PilA
MNQALGKEETMISKFNEALLKLWTRFHDEDGQALAEYGLILGLIAVVCIIALTGIGLAISGQLSAVSGALGGGGGSP